MPPKGGPSKKTEKKEQEKVIQDKTFGLKNKNKSKTVQKFCKGVESQVKKGNVSEQKVIDREFAEKKEKKKAEEEKALLASLYKSVDTVKNKANDADEDPKMKVCAYFKQGLCQKGKKCKYSHDLKLEKTENIDIYTDQRVQMDEEENNKDWDATKLQSVVSAQESKYKNQNPTQIVCKFFIDAVENYKYGWKWVCPNGMNCIYRHCLPPDYVLKRDRKIENEEDIINILEEIEEARMKITSDSCTKITKEIFEKWKEDKKKKKEEEIENKRKEEAKKTGGKGLNVLSGKQLFSYDPTLFVDDMDAADDEEYEIIEEDQEEENGPKYSEDSQMKPIKESMNEDDTKEEEEKKEM